MCRKTSNNDREPQAGGNGQPSRSRSSAKIMQRIVVDEMSERMKPCEIWILDIQMCRVQNARHGADLGSSSFIRLLATADGQCRCKLLSSSLPASFLFWRRGLAVNLLSYVAMVSVWMKSI
jgi:hypothetical protein